MPAFLIVRLGALGDIVHGLPVAAALRAAFPGARIDWLASARHRAVLDLVPVIDRRLLLSAPGGAERPAPERRAFAGPIGTLQAVRVLRTARYDAAFDLQGLIKSAVLARLSGARQVIGFAGPYLRERPARAFYSETVAPAGAVHVVDKNLALLAAVGVLEARRVFPLARPASAALETVRAQVAEQGRPAFVLMSPGAGWPNKRWPAERYGAVAATLLARHGLPSFVLWGQGEENLARAVADRSAGAATLAPPTTVGDLVTLSSAARLVIAGDTGPLHLAAAAGAPIVGIFGPTSPARNGPWDPADICLSRFETCECHHKRRCRRATACVVDITVEEVVAAASRRLAAAEGHA